ncbi:hypothetical protein LguiA_012617 [Lonicera macranthoides]
MHFWEDTWVGDSPLLERFPRLFNLSSLHNVCIESLVSRDPSGSNIWNLGFHRNLNDFELIEFASLVTLIENVMFQDNGSDYRVWSNNSPGLFSCHSFFKYIFDSRPYAQNEDWKFIWKDGIPSKVKVLVWVALKRKLNTCDLLQKRRPSKCLSPHWCVLCKSAGEDLDHLFLHCSFISFIFTKCFIPFR